MVIVRGQRQRTDLAQLSKTLGTARISHVSLGTGLDSAWGTARYNQRLFQIEPVVPASGLIS